MKLVKYFTKKSLTILLLLLVLFGGLFAYENGETGRCPRSRSNRLWCLPLIRGASPSEVQAQVTDVLEESIQSLGGTLLF